MQGASVKVDNTSHLHCIGRYVCKKSGKNNFYMALKSSTAIRYLYKDIIFEGEKGSLGRPPSRHVQSSGYCTTKRRILYGCTNATGVTDIYEKNVGKGRDRRNLF